MGEERPRARAASGKSATTRGVDSAPAVAASPTGTGDHGLAAALRPRLARPLLRSLRRAHLALFGLVVLGTVTLAATLAPAIAPHDPEQGDLRFAKLPPAWNSGGDPSYLLGTDQLGRDIVSRMLFGARISLLVGITVVAIAGTLGVIIGLVAGYYGGRIDDGLMRIADIQLAVPFILFAISVMAVLGPGLLNLIVVLGLSSWVSYGRVVRGTVLALRAREFVEAAQASGAGTGRILFRHILPNVVAPVLVVASFAVASAILSEAALSFLGLGVPPATPSWGGMVASGRDGIQTGQWWMATFPGLAIMLTVLGINVVGDWLRDYFDPRLRV